MAAITLISLSADWLSSFGSQGGRRKLLFLSSCFTRGKSRSYNPATRTKSKGPKHRPTLSSPRTVGRPPAMAKFCESAFLPIVNPFRTSRPPLPLSRPSSHPRPEWKSFVEPAPTRKYLTSESVVGIRQSRMYQQFQPFKIILHVFCSFG